MALASQAYQEERAAAEAAFEAHAEAAAKDQVQLMEGPLTAGLGDEGRRELTQAHEEELAVAASERVLVLAEIDAVARRKAQDTENKVRAYTYMYLFDIKLKQQQAHTRLLTESQLLVYCCFVGV